MVTKRLASIKGKVLRLTRLDECGIPVVGTCSVVVTSGFISVELTEEVESGEEYSVKNAWGEFCVNEKDSDVTKWVNASVNMCQVDPDVLDMFANANPAIFTVVNNNANIGIAANVLTVSTAAAHGLSPGDVVTFSTITTAAYLFLNAQAVTVASVVDADTFTAAFTHVDVAPGVADGIGTAGPITIGASFGTTANDQGIAIEVWTKATGQNACAGGVTEWGYFVVPFIKNGRLDGGVTIENGPLDLTLTGQGFANPNWTVGPHGDNPWKVPAGLPVADPWGVVTTNVQPPAPTAGCTALV